MHAAKIRQEKRRKKRAFMSLRVGTDGRIEKASKPKSRSIGKSPGDLCQIKGSGGDCPDLQTKRS